MTFRSRKEVVEYNKHRRDEKPKTECIFCDLKPGDTQHLDETKSFKIIRNIFAYSFWDNQDVVDHLMIIPKKHIDSLNDLTANESVEFVDLIGSYESRGYNIWARAPQSAIKSVVHQHTHLIKPGTRRKRFLLYVKKPYFRITR